MPESMTTVEIEDVLSSIRRLVSEDLRPTHRLVSAALQNAASKLILTPALRIVADVRSAQPERIGEAEDARDLRTVLLDIEAGTDDDAPVPTLPVFGSVRLSDPAAQAALVPGAEPDLAGTDANFLTTAMSRINGLSSGDTGAAGQPDRIEAVVAAVGAAVGPDEWELDGGDPAPQAKAWADTVWNSDAAGDKAAVAADDLGQADGAFDKAGAEAGVDLGADAAIELTEAAAHVGLADKGPLLQDNHVLAGSDSIVFYDASAAEPEKPAQETAEFAEDPDDTAGFVSEDVLREIVRDMIREELQGNLGERITSNVRKLVRAEINRALASQNYQDIASRG